MRIRRDHDSGAAFMSAPREGVAQIETIGLAVDFERHPFRQRRAHNPIEIHLQRLALQQPAAHRMSKDIHPGTFQRLQNALRRLCLALAVVRMHGRDNDIKLREAVISEIEAKRYLQAYINLIQGIAPVVNAWPEVPQIDRALLAELPRVTLPGG